jgi:hypothetical protein
MLGFLESGKPGTRKRAVGCLAALSASMTDALLGRGFHSPTPELNLRTFGHIAHVRAQLEHHRHNGTHPRINLGCMGDKVSLS